MTRLTGATVLVTGAASGIGAATAARALQEGASVVACDLESPSIDGPADRVRSMACDVTDDAAVAATVATAVDVFGRLDGVVHAAGVAGGGPVHLIDRAEWDRIIDVNLTGTFLVGRHAVTQMLTQAPVDGARGSIVNLASIEGIEGTAGGSAYNASKGGVVLLTKSMAIDYGRQGIRVNALCPGFIDTPMMQAVVEMDGMETYESHMVDEHKLRRKGRAEEMAAAAAFLLSSDASFVTGHALVADGGYTAGRDHGLTELMGL
ncbi:MAG TPA: SDR family oxidoreductase [Microthrixaceae bacterium]|nr:SDR family oxidoreductase [Microthrixaceae bacterium]